jgi:hypothetical protein
MTGTVTIPTWAFLVLLAFALWAALEWLLSARAYAGLSGAKVNRVLRELSVRLNIELPQFKLTRRQVLIDRLFHDARVRRSRRRRRARSRSPSG